MAVDDLAKKLGHASYEAYLKSAHWKGIRTAYEESGLPQACAACDFPRFSLHHRGYENLGQESMADLVPLCNRCHREAHAARKQYDLPAARPDVVLQKVFGWSNAKREARFAPFRKLWEKDRRLTKKHHAPPKKAAVDGNYYKLASKAGEVRRFLDSGYTVPQVASMYGVSSGYVRGYLADHEPEVSAALHAKGDPVLVLASLDKDRETIRQLLAGGASPVALAKLLNVDEALARAYVARHRNDFPVIKSWRWESLRKVGR